MTGGTETGGTDTGRGASLACCGAWAAQGFGTAGFSLALGEEVGAVTTCASSTIIA